MRLSPTSPRFLGASISAAATVALLAGCPDREIAEVNPSQDKAELKDIPVQINRKIDLLFVVDNSNSMEEEQQNLRRNFPRFIEVLSEIEGGLPDVRIGVVSTDVGGGGDTLAAGQTENNTDQSCTRNKIGDAWFGDNGELLYGNPRITTDNCEAQFAMQKPYLAANGTDAASKNFTGDLAAAFQCIADLGDVGCGFEQPLEAMKRALTPGANGDFRRPDAFLAVVILSDEDDCSVADPTLISAAASGALGPRVSFRCFEFGVKCDEGGRGIGPRNNCVASPDSQYTASIESYAKFLKDLNGTGPEDDARVIVAGIIGLKTDTLLPAPVAVDQQTVQGATVSRLLPVCRTATTGDAAPGVRLKQFFDQFPDRNTTTTICDEDLSGGLVLIAELLKKVIGNPCIEGNLKDVNPVLPGEQFDCSVSDVLNPGTSEQSETIIGQCVGANPAPPCWRISANPELCATAPHYEIDVIRAEDPPTGTVQRVQCVVGGETPAP